MVLVDMLSSTNDSGVDICQFNQQTKSWFNLFLPIYPSKHITPYMHALLWHVPEFLELHGTLYLFTQPCLENLNDKTTTDFFRSAWSIWRILVAWQLSCSNCSTV